MNSLRRTTIVLLFGTLLSMAVACSGDDQAASQSTSTAATTATNDSTPEDGESTNDDRESTRLAEPFSYKSATGPGTDIGLIASEMGFFDDYNLDVELVPLDTGGAANIPILESGSIDVLNGLGSSAVILTRGNGANIMGVGSGSVTGPRFTLWYYWVRADSGIETAEDLEGLRVAVNNPAATPDIALSVWMTENGADPTTVERVTVPYANMPAALLSDQVDVIATIDSVLEPYMAQNPDEAAQMELLITASDTLPTDRNIGMILFREDFIEDHPDVVRAHLAALADAAEWIEANQEEALQTWIDNGHIADASAPVPYYPANLCIDGEAADAWVEALELSEQMPAGQVPSGSWYTNDFIPGGCP